MTPMFLVNADTGEYLLVHKKIDFKSIHVGTTERHVRYVLKHY